MKRVALLLLGGCTLYFGDDNRHQVVDPPPPSPPESTPRQEFDQDVAPIISAKCAACHVGGSEALFGNQNTTDSYYNAIVANPELNGGWIPEQSELFIKGEHEGPALTATEAAAISQWLIDEGKVRGTVPDPTPTPTPDGVEAQWAACISVSEDLLMSSGAYTIANQPSSSGSCASCHAVGGPVVFGTADAMIASWSTRAGLEQMFVPQQQADGSYRMQLDEANLDNKGQEQTENTGTHPSYLLDSTVLDDLDAFVVDVQARLDAGGCPAPSSSF